MFALFDSTNTDRYYQLPHLALTMKSLPLLFYLLSRCTGVVGVRQEHSQICNEWKPSQKADANQLLPVSIVLKQQNVDVGIETLLRISDPSSSDYGKHLSAREVTDMFAPKPSAVSSVMNWLEESGIDQKRVKHSHSGEVLSLDLSVREAEKLLETSFYHQTHEKTEQEQVTCQYYHIPESVAGSIDYVHAVAPVSTYRRKLQEHQRLELRSLELLDHDRHQEVFDYKDTAPGLLRPECYNQSSLPCLRALYGIPEDISPHPNSSLAVYQPTAIGWIPEDLDAFFERWQKPLRGSRPKVVPVNGGVVNENWSLPLHDIHVEPNLDFEYTMSLTAPQEVTDISVEGNLHDMLASFDKFFCNPDGRGSDKVPIGWSPSCNKTACDCGNLELPKVISISYGWTETCFAPSYLHRQCNQFLKLGLMGTTVAVSISDHGTSTNGGQFCIDDPTGNGTDGKFSALFPASCPWVTSVGGTQMLKPTKQSLRHTVLETTFRRTGLSSGGTFSNVFSMPPYQARDVASYMDLEKDHLDKLRDRFDSTGRGYPDVAVRADTYPIVNAGKHQMVQGTSASNPVFASMITLINSERMHAGKSSVGFINPVLYGYPNALNDIVTGANAGCGIEEAFRAAPGWDAVTGMGSPDYERLRDVFMSLP